VPDECGRSRRYKSSPVDIRQRDMRVDGRTIGSWNNGIQPFRSQRNLPHVIAPRGGRSSLPSNAETKEFLDLIRSDADLKNEYADNHFFQPSKDETQIARLLAKILPQNGR
jgi:hypothetical protein